MNVKLSKVVSNHSNLRSDVILGRSSSVPVEGIPFFMAAEPLKKFDSEGNTNLFRSINTSVVTSVQEVSENNYTFQTENSTYILVILEN